MQVENRDIFSEICIRATVRTLQNIALSGLLSPVLELIRSQRFWFLRVQYRARLIKSSMIVEWSDGDWRRAYRALQNGKLWFTSPVFAKILLDNGYDKRGKQHNDLISIARQGDMTTLEMFYKRGWRKMPTSILDTAIGYTARRGYLAMYLYLLAKRPRPAPSVVIRALELAIVYGRLNLISHIISDPRAILDCNRVRDAFSYICQKGKIDVVRFLVSDSRFSRLFCCDRTIDIAREHGHVELEQLLIEKMNADAND